MYVWSWGEYYSNSILYDYKCSKFFFPLFPLVQGWVNGLKVLYIRLLSMPAEYKSPGR